jgi:hypothetical protein
LYYVLDFDHFVRFVVGAEFIANISTRITSRALLRKIFAPDSLHRSLMIQEIGQYGNPCEWRHAPHFANLYFASPQKRPCAMSNDDPFVWQEEQLRLRV